MSRTACPCDSDGCPFNNAPVIESALPSDAYDPPEPWEGEEAAAVEETFAHLNAGEAGKWGET